MKRGEIGEDTLPKWIQEMHQSNKMVDMNELRFFGKYGINYDIDELVAENSMFNESNYTKVSLTGEEDEVDVVEGSCKERLVLSQIIIYKESGVKCVPCLTIFR